MSDDRAAIEAVVQTYLDGLYEIWPDLEMDEEEWAEGPDGNVVVGLYMDMMSGVNRSYIASAGAFAGFDFPFSIATSVWDMNSSGEVVGQFTDAAKRGHGFLLSLGDLVATLGANPQASTGSSFSFVSVDFPGATTTSAFGINAQGDIVGNYVDAGGKIHAFLLNRGRRRGQ